jgi:hypothetical protein
MNSEPIQITSEQIEGIRQLEALRKERIERVMAMYVEVNGKMVKKNKRDKKNK